MVSLVSTPFVDQCELGRPQRNMQGEKRAVLCENERACRCMHNLVLHVIRAHVEIVARALALLELTILFGIHSLYRSVSATRITRCVRYTGLWRVGEQPSQLQQILIDHDQ